MIVRPFVDTNIFVYADDPCGPIKRARTTELIATTMPLQIGVGSTQVLPE
jgi:predicted nucleic acid-binding protein